MLCPHHCWLFAQALISGKVVSTRQKIANVLQKCFNGSRDTQARRRKATADAALLGKVTQH